MSESVIVLNPISAEIINPSPIDVNLASPDPVNVNIASPDPINVNLASPDPVNVNVTNVTPISFPDDSALYSAFGRLRVANPFTLWDSQFQYGKQPEYWDEYAVGAGSAATHLPNESSIAFTCGASANSVILRTTRNYLRYKPGKSQLFITTGNLGGQQANQFRRMGYFDDQNGVFLELDGTNANIVLRTYVSGGLYEHRIPQASWNINPLMGAAGSPTLVWDKAQIFVADLEWLGVGRVRCGFFIGGQLYYAHEFNHSNVITTTYMTTANLPLRYEVRNTALQAGPTTGFKQICSTVISEGGENTTSPDQIRSASTPLATTTTIPVALTPILSIRLKSTFNGITNRGLVKPTSLDLLITGSKNCYWELVLNPTINPSVWNPVDASSIVEYNVDATTISGGFVIASGFAAGVNQSKGFTPPDLNFKSLLSRNWDNTSSDIFTLSMRSLESSANAGYASLGWIEIH